MTWRVAKSLLHLRDQVNARWPNRRKDSDGTIGNAEHSSRTSDHNPNPEGVVCAIDITHDPASGCDSYALAETLRANRDPRIKYIISNRRIASGSDGPAAWTWRKYTGANPHDHHCHISVKSQKALYDAEGDWKLEGMAAPATSYIPPKPTLRKGAKGGDVQTLQGRLNANGAVLKVDGDFGAATEAAVKKFQAAKKLVADGIVGPMTWKTLGRCKLSSSAPSSSGC